MGRRRTQHRLVNRERLLEEDDPRIMGDNPESAGPDNATEDEHAEHVEMPPPNGVGDNPRGRQSTTRDQREYGAASLGTEQEIDGELSVPRSGHLKARGRRGHGMRLVVGWRARLDRVREPGRAEDGLVNPGTGCGTSPPQ